MSDEMRNAIIQVLKEKKVQSSERLWKEQIKKLRVGSRAMFYKELSGLREGPHPPVIRVRWKKEELNALVENRDELKKITGGYSALEAFVVEKARDLLSDLMRKVDYSSIVVGGGAEGKETSEPVILDRFYLNGWEERWRHDLEERCKTLYRIVLTLEKGEVYAFEKPSFVEQINLLRTEHRDPDLHEWAAFYAHVLDVIDRQIVQK